jgi:hypothetical protein
MSPDRTHSKATATGDAARRIKEQLRRPIQRLWIMTPVAAHIAAFEEDSRPDPRTILE